jgi:tetratricopeptide (TPR) repeat protein
MVKNKKEWSLDRHKQASPQFKVGTEHQDKQHKTSLRHGTIGFMIGVILTVLTFNKSSEQLTSAVNHLSQENSHLYNESRKTRIELKEAREHLSSKQDEIFKETHESRQSVDNINKIFDGVQVQKLVLYVTESEKDILDKALYGVFNLSLEELKQKTEKIEAMQQDYIAKGVASLKANDCYSAINYFEPLIKMDPTNMLIWRLKNEAFLCLPDDKREEVLLLYDKAFNANQNDILSRTNKAWALFISRQYQSAVDLLPEEIISKKPELAMAWMIKGYALQELGREEAEVEKVMKKATTFLNRDFYSSLPMPYTRETKEGFINKINEKIMSNNQ